MKSTAFQIGVLRDAYGSDDSSNIFELTLNIIDLAKNIRDSYNATSSLDARFEDMSVSSSTSISYAIWHLYSKIRESKTLS